MYRFNKFYLISAIFLFLTEVFIALYMHDEIIRPYGGDFLVVILLYCIIKSFLNSDFRITALSVLLFSYLIEISQYFHLTEVLNPNNSNLIRIITGDYFSWTDILAYTLGTITIICTEALINRQKSRYLHQQKT